MITKFYKVHTRAPSSNGFTVYFGHAFPAKPNVADIAKQAVNKGLLDPEDLPFVSYAVEITEEEYLRATN